MKQEQKKSCRDLGIGHDYIKKSETNDTTTFRCTSCGHEFTEEKRKMITPERKHQ